MTRAVKQYGLHRSGTNFLRVILQENYQVAVYGNEGGWKHGHFELTEKLGRELDCAICVKNPYAWLVSLHRFRYPQKEVPFKMWARSQIQLSGKRATGGIDAPNPVRLWIEMNEHWLSVKLQSHKLYVFPYERVLADPEATVRPLVEDMKLERRVPVGWKLRRLFGASGLPPFYVPPRQLGALRDHYKKKNLNSGATFEPGYYHGREYLKQFDRELIDFVNHNLNPSTVQKLGYEMVTDLPNHSDAASASRPAVI
jgi:hypothetical protein